MTTRRRPPGPGAPGARSPDSDERVGRCGAFAGVAGGAGGRRPPERAAGGVPAARGALAARRPRAAGGCAPAAPLPAGDGLRAGLRARGRRRAVGDRGRRRRSAADHGRGRRRRRRSLAAALAEPLVGSGRPSIAAVAWSTSTAEAGALTWMPAARSLVEHVLGGHVVGFRELVYAYFCHQLSEFTRSGSGRTAERNERWKPPRRSAICAQLLPQTYAPRPGRRCAGSARSGRRRRRHAADQPSRRSSRSPRSAAVRRL